MASPLAETAGPMPAFHAFECVFAYAAAWLVWQTMLDCTITTMLTVTQAFVPCLADPLYDAMSLFA